MAGKRKRALSDDEQRWVRAIGESYKASGMWPDSPELVLIEVAARAAEMAYRRGVSQGAFYMLWHLRGAMGHRPGAPGEGFARKLYRWRLRGHEQKYAKAERPPEFLPT